MILMNFMGMRSIPVAFDLIDVIAFKTSISRTDVNSNEFVLVIDIEFASIKGAEFVSI